MNKLEPKSFNGVIPAMITSFNKNESITFNKIHKSLIINNIIVNNYFFINNYCFKLLQYT